MNSTEIRKRFYDYFVRHGHTQVPSSSLIPAQDPTLLFTNAGMNQFKDVFLGLEKRSYTRAVTIQKCVRAGGKHNDLDNVGFTKRHLTFFEMMGNFSFGDYFKKEAIHFAWEFLTKDLGLETKNLYATVYTTDDDSYDIWRNDIGLPKNKIIRLGEKDNFWQMGELGPCGPSTEIHIDRGAEFGCKDLKKCGPDCECDRFLEIWNLVFMESDRQEDGSLKPLKQTGVDTGMGIERISSLMQDVDSVFETDLFVPLIQKIEKLTGVSYASQKGDKKAAFHVLADHIRSSSLLIADGCAPANDGRGYVLRKIIRRAALFEQKLTQKSIFPELSQAFIQSMKDVYPELEINKKLIYEILKSEIEKFSVNLERGRHILEEYLQENRKKGIKEITGEQAFTLYDTYGFPLELLTAAAREHGLKVDEKSFDQLMQKQQERSGKKLTDPLDHVDIPESITTEFTGYKELETNSEIAALIDEDNQLQNSIAKGKTCWVLSNASPFFIVGGGQVPDEGWLVIGSHKAQILENRYIAGRIASKIKAPAQLRVGDAIISIVDKTWRTNAMKNHTATHLLQAALIELFGKQIKQSGSLVHPDYLRFDFSYHGTLSAEDIKKVEDLVNQKIRDNIPVDVVNTTFKDAVKRGALAFFGDKYNPEKVRMIQIDEFSKELCGGTHVPRTGDIGTFKITEESSLAAGLRRIVAVTGPRAIELFQDLFADIKALGSEYKVKVDGVKQAVLKQKEQCKQLQSEYKQLKKSLNKVHIAEYKKEIEDINGLPFLYKHLDDATHDELKDMAQQLSSHRDGLYVLTSQMNGKYALFALLSNRLQDKIDLKQFATWLKDTFGIKGGGSKTQLQGGTQEIPKGFEGKVKEWLKKAK